MYQASTSYPSPHSLHASPSPPSDPYRASPVPMSSHQPYSMPMSNGASYGSSPGSSAQRYGPGQYGPRGRGIPPGSVGAARQTAYPTPPGAVGGFVQQPSQLPSARHKGTLAPGQIVSVGEATVRIERYLSEGGYAHVYLTTSDTPIYPPVKGEKKGRWGEKGYTQHCLKRIAFEDDNVWVDVRKEIEVMKALPPNPYLVQYLASAHSKLPNGTHEVFILMEFAAGGGIIDLLNKRLRDRLKEIEILNIFTDVCEAVAAMHALKRPLLHRDLKIENVLSAPTSEPPSGQRPMPLIFKLCDFGSTTYPAARPPTTKIEADALAMDLNKHTTLQYRSPEMVEPMLGLAVGLPSDVWALGVLLYKLCYYTTPFEEHGTLAIVNAKYSFPQYPVYSPRLQHLIASMLVEQPVRRPTVFEVLKAAHEMSGTRPLVDYPTPSRTISSASSAGARPSAKSSTSSNLLDFTSPTPSSQPRPPTVPITPAIQPQRRGRPTREGVDSPNTMSGRDMPMPRPPALPQEMASDRTNLTSPPPAPEGRLVQVTGEKAKSPPPSAGSVDAFGMPSMSAPQKAASGFSDSFGSFAQTSKGSSDNRTSRQPSGFGDSFGSNSFNAASLSSPPPIPPSFSSNFSVPQTTSPVSTSKSPGLSNPSSSVPDGEVSFETRFPSIETLGSNDAFSPPAVESSSTHLISPIESRQNSMAPKPGMIGNLTGGQLSPALRSRPAADKIPQPRSTHVTGTAFKQEMDLLSPGPVSTAGVKGRKDYFEGASLSAASGGAMESLRSPKPQDLMTGDDEQSQTDGTGNKGESLPRPPAFSTSTGSRGPAQVPPETGHSRPLLPPLESPRPPSNFESERWSPLEKARLQSQQSTSKDEVQANPRKSAKEDSSDDEAGPESASAVHRRPASPARRPSQQTDGTKQGSKVAEKSTMFQGGSAPQRDTSPTKVKSPDAPSTPSGSSREARSRPFSMVNASPRPPDVGEAVPSPSGRPAHRRKGSINDIVSKYESLNSPTRPAMTPKASSNAPVKGSQKPSVAVKPQALRTASTSEAPLSPSSSKGKDEQPASIKVAPSKAPKPSMKAETSPVENGNTNEPTAKTKPATKPKPTLQTKGTDSQPKDEQSSDAVRGENMMKSPAASSGKSSPEKQQSVNSLIARWNQNR